MVKILPANASSIPGARWSHTSLVAPLEQLSPCATTTEGLRPRAHAMQYEKPLRWEAGALQLDSPLVTTEKPAQQQRPNTAKNKWIKITLKKKKKLGEGNNMANQQQT